ncbi:histidine phosphatase family protein [Arenicella xantha]|uniref:Histidine phosphatase superfamily protein (Branch 1) n=1 Tax=Arenicella xantha TaxID=644221 RepID=A0A395JKV1_9GAMM|nr:histidine phosphatase family protein [Arenicella xantha]RBP51055.1 histidine phosphatase superfamily protein (branch 1) [Arenicella xantha]
MYHKTIYCALLLTLAFTAGCANDPYTTITIVRHAEKIADGSKDPSLTNQGNARALALRDKYTNTPISAVYSTSTNRTKQTAMPLAIANGLTVTSYSTPEEVATAIISKHAGEHVAVVGHSNTVGDIILALGAQIPEGLTHPMDESDYDNLVIVLINNNGLATATHSTYGKVSP